MPGTGIGIRPALGALVLAEPTTVAAVSAFWRSDVGVTGTSAISAWANRRATGDFSQATGTKQPALVAGAFGGTNPGIRFDGSSDGLDGPLTGAVISASEGTVYVLCTVRSIALAAANIYQSDTIITDAGGYWGVGLRSTTGLSAFNYDATVDEAGAQAITLNVPHVLRWRHSGGKVYQRVDYGVETAGVASGDTLTLTSQLRLGYGYTGANYHAAVDVGAVVCAAAALTPAEDALITRWLGRYGGV